MSLKYLFWNVNGRWKQIVDSCTMILQDYDFMFLSETKLPVGCLPTIKNYRIFIDPNIKLRHRGGVAVYVQEKLAKYVTKIRYEECFVSFMLSNVPKYMFIGVYIPPEDSVYADPGAFARLSELLLECRKNGFTPFLGGDFNSRIGNMNDIPGRWNYLPNCDSFVNNYGRTYFTDMCSMCKMHPINDIIYKGKQYPSDFTYIKNSKKSHIDFILTNKDGLKSVTDFKVISNDWHLSDHRPVTVILSLTHTTNPNHIYLRALDLNTERLEKNNVPRLTSKYNYSVVEQYMNEQQSITEQHLTDALQNSDPEAAIELLDSLIQDAHNRPNCKKKSNVNTQKNTKLFDECNAAFEQYCATFDDDETTLEEKTSIANRYASIRNKLTIDVLKVDHAKWVTVLNESSSDLWDRIDWNGKLNAPPSDNFPSPNIFAAHFEDL